MENMEMSKRAIRSMMKRRNFQVTGVIEERDCTVSVYLKKQYTLETNTTL